MKNLFLLLIPFYLLSCSSMSKDECLSADWYILGQDDLLVHHRSKSFFDKRQKQCSKHKVSANKDEYIEGWTDAIKEYCTERIAYIAGKKGKNFRFRLCSDEIKPSLKEKYKKGKKLWRINGYINNARRRISSLKYQEPETKEEEREIEREIKNYEREIRGYEVEKLKYLE